MDPLGRREEALQAKAAIPAGRPPPGRGAGRMAEDRACLLDITRIYV
jgi:hypothetical protein